jgi:hypothetical protein
MLPKRITEERAEAEHRREVEAQLPPVERVDSDELDVDLDFEFEMVDLEEEDKYEE